MPVAPAAQGAATADPQIAAVVNDHVISLKDVNERIALALVTTQLPDTPETRDRLRPEALRSLIDDALKWEEARRLNITVSRDEIERALERIEKQSNLGPGQLARYLADRGLTMKPLIAQVEADLVWRKVVTQQARDSLIVPEGEIEVEAQRLAQSPGSPEFQLEEIFLPVDDPAEVKVQMQLAERLATDIRGGASFAAVARSFSRSASAASGGEVGWVRADQLSSPFANAISRLGPNEVSQPVRTDTGIYLLRVTGRRLTAPAELGPERVSLFQVILPVATSADEPRVRETAQQLGHDATSCDDLQKRVPSTASPLSGRVNRVDLRQTPPELRAIIASLAVDQASTPIRSAEGYIVLMVCEREEQPLSTELRQAVERKLRQDRLEATSRRMLRDLRRTMLVDVRI